MDILTVTSTHYIALSAILFAIGFAGVLTRRNIIIVLMSIELMLNGSNLAFVTFARDLNDMTTQIFVLMVIAVAAAEAAVGLGIVLLLFRNTKSVNIDDINSLKG
ncbi:MAG: NADH-quinone oxidoreductase subunit NuoK [Nitrospinota bacterium]